MELAASEREQSELGQGFLFDDLMSETLEGELAAAEEGDPAERLGWEREVLGFYLSGHPLDDYGDQLARFADCTVAELPAAACSWRRAGHRWRSGERPQGRYRSSGTDPITVAGWRVWQLEDATGERARGGLPRRLRTRRAGPRRGRAGAGGRVDQGRRRPRRAVGRRGRGASTASPPSGPRRCGSSSTSTRWTRTSWRSCASTCSTTPATCRSGSSWSAAAASAPAWCHRRRSPSTARRRPEMPSRSVSVAAGASSSSTPRRATAAPAASAATLRRRRTSATADTAGVVN